MYLFEVTSHITVALQNVFSQHTGHILRVWYYMVTYYIAMSRGCCLLWEVAAQVLFVSC